MKRNYYKILIFASVFCFSLLSADYMNTLIFSESLTQKEEISYNENSNYKYRVSVFNGKLAVFDGDSKMPYKVYDKYVNTLPESDIKLLTDGIKINSVTELMKIIEEYTS